MEQINFQGLFVILVGFVVISIVLEESLGVLFEWKYYKNRFAGKGWKTPIKVLAAFLLCYFYGLDFIANLLKAMNMSDSSESFIGRSITALFLAGGSSTAFKTLNRIREAKKQI